MRNLRVDFHVVLTVIATMLVQPSPAWSAKKSPAGKTTGRNATLALQIALDQSGFSTGEIDGQWGTNAQHILAAFQETNGLPATGELDEKTSAVLQQATSGQETWLNYTISPEDTAGPFYPNIPSGMAEKSKLPSLGYRNILEKLGEKFHINPELLQSLNPKSRFTAGEQIKVPNVEPFELSAVKHAGEDPETSGSKANASTESNQTSESVKAAQEPTQAQKKAKLLTLTVSKKRSILTVTDENNRTILAAPVTTGSGHDPLPIGEWKVDGIEHFPPYTYNPNLFWDARPGDQPAKLHGGPNSPVGVIWIATTKRHYGIHGTPEPGTIGHTESHGCVRLPNWDVTRVAKIVRPGTKILFTE